MPQHANESTAIRNLQQYLRQLSYHDPSISPPPIDGIFDSGTQKSLREFQASQSLPPSGVADRRTWELLYALYRASLGENAPPRAPDIFPYLPFGARLAPGDESFAVAVLQHMLRELSAYHTELEGIVPTGRYDEGTAAAVRVLQERSSLPVTGSVDVATWNAITDQYNILFAVEPYL
jgi:peptidoglycan hydrolase-like protein with peptidoglycan-binding domain